MFVKFIIIIF